MHVLKKTGLFWWMIFVLFIGCAHTHAPAGWLSEPQDLSSDPYGGWITLKLKSNQTLSGELIAVSEDSVYVADNSFHVIPQSDVLKARLVAYNSHAGQMGTWTILGTLSTISHGLFLVLSAPVWMIGGGIAASVRSRDPILDYPKHHFNRLAFYARFAGGLPHGIDRNRIVMKSSRR